MKKSFIVAIVVMVAAAIVIVIWAINYQPQLPATSYNPPEANTVTNANAVTPPANQPAANMPAPANVPPANANMPAAPGKIQVLMLNTVNDPKLGMRLVAANGHALYYFTNDKPGISNCAGVCATNWPAYTVSADASLAGGVGIAGKISTITKPDGSLQVTYNGMPLYFWHTDADSGDTYGQGIGGVWFVAKP